MIDHTDIRKLLSAYCGGDLNEADRELVELHLTTCESCRAELDGLKTTLRLLRTTEHVEPPPWLTARIMARLREEQKEKRSWQQRFFFPLRIKLPLEALAVLMVCVTGYYLSRTVEPVLNRPVPQQEAPALPQPAQTQDLDRKQDQPVLAPAEPEPPRERARNALNGAPPVTSTAPPSPSAHAPAAPTNRSEQTAPFAAPGIETNENAPSAGLSDTSQRAVQKMQKTAPSRVQRTGESLVPARADRALSGTAPAFAYHPRIRVRLSMIDEVSADRRIRQAIAQSNGTVIEDDQAHDERKLEVLIQVSHVSALMDRLGLLGKIAERPAVLDSTGIVGVVIRW